MAGMLLAVFASRMLIPPGFMPAGGSPFSMEICPEGLPADILAMAEPALAESMHMDSMHMDSMRARSATHPVRGAHHHSGSPAPSEHCVFGTACSAGPVPHLPLPGDFPSAPHLRAAAFASIAGAVHLVHLPPPRAPPGLPS